MVLKILFGLGLIVFGLNKFLDFMPPLVLEGGAADFIGALVGSGYMWQFIALVEIIAGVLLVANKFVPLALVIVFPVMLNALMFHLFLDIKGIAPAFIFNALNIYLFFANKERYNGILSA